MLHEMQNHATTPAVKTPFVKLLLEGAKREAVERRRPVKKAQVLSQNQILVLLDKLWGNGPGHINPSLSLTQWRAIVRIYTMYKTLCPNDCLNELLATDFIFYEDHVQITFARAKNDQFYSSSVCILGCLPNMPAYCPKIIYQKYFEVMGFKRTGTEYLNCRLRFSKKPHNRIIASPHLRLAYTSSLAESRELCLAQGFEGSFSEKSYKVNKYNTLSYISCI